MEWRSHDHLHDVIDYAAQTLGFGPEVRAKADVLLTVGMAPSAPSHRRHSRSAFAAEAPPGGAGAPPGGAGAPPGGVPPGGAGATPGGPGAPAGVSGTPPAAPPGASPSEGKGMEMQADDKAEGTPLSVIQHEADVPWSVNVGVKSPSPEDLKPGGSIVPIDAARQEMKDQAMEEGKEVEKERQTMVEERRARFERGDEVPAVEIPETVSQNAHQLMQSGDYGDGPPFPLHYPAPPPWRAGQKEVMKVIEIKRADLGKGESHEFIRCYKGRQEVSCGVCHGPDVEKEDMDEEEEVKASMGGGGTELVPASSIMTMAAGPGSSCGDVSRRRRRASTIYRAFL
mmetsp:Transcript_144639/g.265586  ORF Transcript_144639/g.265586 Transcript_144639/m.265586 type:complete len:341 (-) Transcript_144639:71-1093(-)